METLIFECGELRYDNFNDNSTHPRNSQLHLVSTLLYLYFTFASSLPVTTHLSSIYLTVILILPTQPSTYPTCVSMHVSHSLLLPSRLPITAPPNPTLPLYGASYLVSPPCSPCLADHHERSKTKQQQQNGG